MTYSETVKFLVAMIIMMNPLGSLSIYLDLTRYKKTALQLQIAKICGVTIMTVMFLAVWAGSQLLDLLGININAFRIAGGIILLLTGLSMLESKVSPISHTKQDDVAAEERHSIAVVPLAIPIIVGPGAISTLIIAASDSTTMTIKIWLSLLCIPLALGMYAILRYGAVIANFFGESVIKVITKIMGMIIMAIAVGMLADGMVGLIPALGG